MVPRASAAEPARQDDLGTVLAVGRSMDSECEDPASASECALRRHSSEVGAVCSNPARTDLCGGRWETGVPTATKQDWRSYCLPFIYSFWSVWLCECPRFVPEWPILRHSGTLLPGLILLEPLGTAGFACARGCKRRPQR